MRFRDWSSDWFSSDLKLCVHGLSHIIAMENASCNVRANVIAPFAWTRMIGTIPVKDEASRVRVARIKNFMRADQVADFAVALVAPAANAVRGQLFWVRGGEQFGFNQTRAVGGIWPASSGKSGG